MHNTDTITLSGSDLTVQMVQSVANGARVTLAPEGLQVMQRARRVLEQAADKGQPIYGVTTGLGPKVVEALPQDAIDHFSVNTIRGRTHGVGNALPTAWVRAGMAVRVNTLLTGAAGVRPELAEHLALCLNRQFTPCIPQTGTIGVADLNWGGAFGSALLGEGLALTSEGRVIDAAEALATAGIAVLTPQRREGLALVSHSCFTAGISAVALCALQRSYTAAQLAAALSMEGFRANVAALDSRALAVRPQQGQQQAASQLRQHLQQSALLDPGAARRLQDPLSIRNIAQVHGSVQATLNTLSQAIADEINGASDNPAVLVDDNLVLSHGGYLPVYLCIALSSTLQAMVHLAALQVSRISKLLFERFSGLSNGLTTAGSDGAGLAPLMKTAESLYAEISHLATPAPVYPGLSADGLEDVVTHAAIPAQATLGISHRLNRLSAIEMLVALQAIDVRDN
ncbi:MAG: aromatic amino acid ammonia-lyase [Pseudomonadota bacterium]